MSEKLQSYIVEMLTGCKLPAKCIFTSLVLDIFVVFYCLFATLIRSDTRRCFNTHSTCFGIHQPSSEGHIFFCGVTKNFYDRNIKSLDVMRPLITLYLRASG
jgi:hypothetical protein